MAKIPAYPGAPHWVKISAVIAAIFALLVVILLLVGGGPHGPGRHLASGETTGQAQPSGSNGQ